MSKKRSVGVELPDVANMDDLALISDEELVGRAARMEADRRRAASRGADLQPWEAEVAYVRREQAIRQRRAEAHIAYLQAGLAEAVTAEAEVEQGAVLN